MRRLWEGLLYNNLKFFFKPRNQSYYNNKEVVCVSFLHSHGTRCKFSICKIKKMLNLDPFQSGKTLEAVGQEGFSSVRHQQDLSQNVGKWDKHKKKWWRRRGVRACC